MANYMLLLYNGPDNFADYSPEEMQGIVARYFAWRDELRQAGRFVGSDKLMDNTGRVLRRANGQTRVLDGPFSETKEVIGGYFAVSADGYDEAVEIAGSCPHLDYGGTIEIREIDADH